MILFFLCGVKMAAELDPSARQGPFEIALSILRPSLSFHSSFSLSLSLGVFQVSDGNFK